LKPRLKLIFFITGNPGLIGYYHPFLSLLVRGLETADDLANSGKGNGKDDGKEGRDITVVAGMSLGGFDVVTASPQISEDRQSPASDNNEGGQDQEFEMESLYPETWTGKQPPYSLRDQIELSYVRLDALVKKLRTQYDLNDDENVQVTLMGHSVGAYIALEIVRLRHETLTQQPRVADATTESQAKIKWKPTTCILLTPTIQDLHLSPSGIMATPLLTILPFLPDLAHTFVHRMLLLCVPESWLLKLVSNCTNMKTGSHGLDTTVAFLQSKQGVRQALYLASFELKEMREDKWGEEVWGVTREDGTVGGNHANVADSPNLFFWFAKEDHWVAEKTKQAIIDARGGGTVKSMAYKISDGVQADGQEVVASPASASSTETTGARIEMLETDGLTHAWCLKQSEFVAKQVASWISQR
jgi:hypothetical protein